ncbi:MarR family winged helix-turn-helix transcriptional regulator [Streptomyces parvus]|uniref:MarR family winged helix-turn-helix transcriptional regulator n=1 Tax=Streptomyces TaxID=1883 RepID=UPI000BFB1376|nr:MULTISPECIES: MarR family transcriptional regulator [unclassified Streptomyces]PVD02986.1 MarR family transcriptional regulator [Streptomyces sp. CS147]
MDDAEAQALNRAIRLLSLRHRARAAELLAPLGLSTGQEALLLELSHAGATIQAQLSSALGCEPPSVTVMIRKLEARGIVRRGPSPTDKRATLVELTDDGRALVERIGVVWRQLADETVTGLDDATASGLAGLLMTLTGNIDDRYRIE